MDKSLAVDGLSLTKTEMLLGSPLYMSPEQMRSSKSVDERSDLWALGVIAFELLTGRLPFEADSILELCFKVAQENAPNAKEIRPDLPDALCAAVAKCLEKEPGDRFANVGELAHAFEPFALARDRGTAERALDVLGTGKRPPQRSSPSFNVEAAPQTPAISLTPLGSLSPSDPAVVAAAVTAVAEVVPSSPEPVAPAAWGTTQAQTAAKSRKGLIALAASVVVVVALGGTLLALRSAPADGATAARAATAPSGQPNARSEASTGMAPSATSSATPSVAASAAAAESDAGAVAVVASASAAVAPVKPAVRPAATARPAKPVASAAQGAPPADPGGFIKVRE
jgi:serine/threonine-protein kinase